MTQTYYTFDYDGVIEFEGYLDTLYGSVSVDRYNTNTHRLPYNCSELGKNVWKTHQEALDVFEHSVTEEVQKAILRYVKAKERYPSIKWILS